jgi:predicted GIY-YIG superfamily endonuclease
MKTRKLMKGVLFVAGIIMLTAACHKDNGPTLDFNITLPTGWYYYIIGNEGFVYQAVSPVKNDNDSITEDLTVLKYKAENTTLESFYTGYVTNLAKDTSFHALSSKDTTINGEAAVKLTHLQTVQLINSAMRDTIVIEAQMQKYFMMNKNYGFVLSFNALLETFKDYKPIFDNIISTFTFKE